jgi:DNA-binding beta-propeller fold protein YncE
MSHDLERIARVDIATGSRRRGPVVGRGASDIAAQGRSLYVTNLVSRTVQRRHASTGRLLARTPPLAGSPVRVVPGEGSLWVAERTTMPGGADSLVELDPRTLDQRRRIPLAQGVRALRTGGGAVWILSRRAREVARLDPPTGRIDKVVRLHEEGEDLAYAHGRLWIANRDDDTVTRMDAATGRSVTLAVPREPARIAARGNDVWVTSYLEGTLTRIDARRDRIIGTPVAVGVQPYGVAVTPDSVWVTSPGEDRLRQVATD